MEESTHGDLYLPVESGSTNKIANDKLAGRVQKGTSDYVLLTNTHTGAVKSLLRRIGKTALKVTQPGDTAYVVCHGYQDSSGAARLVGTERGDKLETGFISIYSGGKSRLYDPERLAKHLKAENLADRIDLKLFVCGSALQAASGAEAFAKRLKVKLVALGYSNNLRLAGYSWDLSGAFEK